ncbi:MAG: HEPN domain-containing protein [Bradymonadaceae bacterium]
MLEGETFDLTAFHVQQSAELALRFALVRASGNYPQTHQLKRLLDTSGAVLEREERVEDFIETHVDVLSNMENAYITARYLPGDFRRSEVEHMVDTLDALEELLTELEG